jgi:hypothetical protein
MLAGNGMSEPTYQIVFRGKILSGFDRDQVRNNLAGLFRTDPARIDAILDAPKTVLKSGIGKEAATRYQEVLRGAGIMVAVMAEASEASAPVAAPAPASAPAAPPAPAAPASSAPAADGLTLAPVGTQLLPPQAKVQREFDLSAMSLAPVGAVIGDQTRPSARQFDLSALSLATDTGPIDPTQKAKPANIDTSALTLAERPPEPEPELSELQKQMLME